MAYASNEGSRHGGQPVECYRFTVGQSGTPIFNPIQPTDPGNFPADPEPPGLMVVPWGEWSGILTQSSANEGADCILTTGESHRCLLAGRSDAGYLAGTYSGIISGSGSYYLTLTQAPAYQNLTPSKTYTLRLLIASYPSFQPKGARIPAPYGDGNAYGHQSDPARWQYVDRSITADASGIVQFEWGHFATNAGYSNIVFLGGAAVFDPEAEPDPEDPGGAPGGSTQYHYTSADVTVTFNGATYLPAIFTRTALTSGQSEGGDVELTVPRDHPVALLFRDGLPVAPVSSEIFRLHRPDLAAAAGEDPSTTLYATAFRGRVTRARWRGATCTLTLSGGQAWLERKLPRVLIQPQCNWTLYGTGCGLDRESFRFDSAIAAITGREVTITGLETESGADIDKFQNGFIITASGEMAFIETQDGDVVTLLNPPTTIAVDDSVRVYQGCDRTPGTCHARFNNLANFGGDALLPHKNPFGPSGFNL